MSTLKALKEFAQVILAKKPASVPDVIMHSPVAGSAKGAHFELGLTKGEKSGKRAKFGTPASAVKHFITHGHGNVVEDAGSAAMLGGHGMQDLKDKREEKRQANPTSSTHHMKFRQYMDKLKKKNPNKI